MLNELPMLQVMYKLAKAKENKWKRHFHHGLLLADYKVAVSLSMEESTAKSYWYLFNLSPGHTDPVHAW